MSKCSRGISPRLVSAIVATGICLAASVAPAQPGSEPPAALIEVHLAAQPLRQALRALADAMHVQLAFDPSDVDPRAQSPALSGSYSVDQAFTEILAKSG